MYKLKTVENMVLNVLISTPDARDDDMRLYYYVCRDCISETHGNTHLSFEEVIILSLIGIVPVVWLALLIAPFVKGGLTEIVTGLMKSFEHPFQIQICEDSVKTVLFLFAAYAVGIGIYFSTRRNYRRREEHGSAKWGNAKAVDRKYRQSPPSARHP